MPKTRHRIGRAALVMTFIMGLGFARVAAADTLTLQWDLNPEPEVTGYTVYVGTQTGVYSQTVDVGNTDTFVLSNAVAGQRYYFAVAAYSPSATSPLSQEVSGFSNAYPLLLNPGNQTNTVGQSVSVPLSGSDPLGDAITYSATGLPPGLVVSQNLGVIAGTVTTAGAYNVTASVSDGVLVASQSFTWTVQAASTNVAPVLTNPGNQTSTVGQSVVLQLQASDANGQTLTFSGSGLPPGLQLAAGTGRVTGTPATAGTFQVSVAVSDGSLSAQRSFTWTVQTGQTNVAPVLTDPGSQMSTVGQSVALQLLASDANGQPLTFGSSGLPPGLQLAASTGRIAGTPTTAGAFQVSVTVSDGSLSAQRSFMWTVLVAQPNNVAPVLADPGNQTTTVGQSVVVQLQASDANGQALAYSISGLPAGLQLTASTGRITGTPTTAGIFQVSVAVSDGSLSAQRSFIWTVVAAAPSSNGTSKAERKAARKAPSTNVYSGTMAVVRESTLDHSSSVADRTYTGSAATRANPETTTDHTNTGSSARTRTTADPTALYAGGAIVRSVSTATSSTSHYTGTSAVARRPHENETIASVSTKSKTLRSVAQSENPTGDQALLRNEESTIEGGDSGANASTAIDRTATAPVAGLSLNIETPVEHASFVAGSTVMLSAVAREAGEGDLTSRIVWTSSLDGRLGTGGTVFKVLTSGTHSITASVTDSRGVTRVAQITIVIGG